MGRRIVKRCSRLGPIAFALVATLALVGCENALQTYVFETLFGVGWKIASFSGPERVLPVETWETRSNGFPQQIGTSSDGKVHVVLYSVNDWTWLYAVREPGAAFPDTYGVVQSGIYTLAVPSMVFLLNDLPVIAYADRDGGGPGYNLCYQEKQLGDLSTWGPQRALYTHPSPIYGVSMFFLVSDTLRPRFFYQADNKVYQTLMTGTSTIDPSPPGEFLASALAAAVFQLDTDDVGFVYATTDQSLSYTRFRNNSPLVIWSTADPEVEIASVAAVADASGKVHVVLGTRNPDAALDPSYDTCRYLTNAGESWSDMGSFSGSAASGPYVGAAPALAVIRDSEGNDHLHMAYTVLELPLSFSAWYAYFDEGQWQVAPQSLDDSRNGFYPSLAADDAGNLHLLYSDYMAETDRELYYMKGVPARPQDR